MKNLAFVLVSISVLALTGCYGDSNVASPTNSESGYCGQQVVDDYNNAMTTCGDTTAVNFQNDCHEKAEAFQEKYPNINCQVAKVYSKGGPYTITSYDMQVLLNLQASGGSTPVAALPNPPVPVQSPIAPPVPAAPAASDSSTTNADLCSAIASDEAKISSSNQDLYQVIENDLGFSGRTTRTTKSARQDLSKFLSTYSSLSCDQQINPTEFYSEQKVSLDELDQEILKASENNN